MRAWQLLSVPFVLTSVASAHPGHPHWVNELTHHMVEMLVVLGCVLVVWRLAGRVGVSPKIGAYFGESCGSLASSCDDTA